MNKLLSEIQMILSNDKQESVKQIETSKVLNESSDVKLKESKQPSFDPKKSTKFIVGFVQSIGRKASAGDVIAIRWIQETTSNMASTFTNWDSTKNVETSTVIQESIVPLTQGQELYYHQTLEDIGENLVDDINAIFDEYGLRHNDFIVGLIKTTDDFETNLKSVFWDFISGIFTPFEIVSLQGTITKDDWNNL